MDTTNIFSLKNKVIVVTGGTGILGGAFVKGIANAGGSVVILGRNSTVGNERADEINAGGGDAIFIAVDVLEEADLLKAKEIILEKYGKIDGLVNAAGGNIPEAVVQPDADIFNMNIDGMKRAMVLNLWGTIIPTQIFGSVMAKNGSGSIVNISSVSSKQVVTKVLGYSMGKAAVDIYTQWFGVEVANRFGDAIRVNAIMPGFFLTEQNRTLLTQPDGSYTDRGNSVIKNTPFKRFGKPEELVGALVYLLSDASKFVTGMQLGVDGGFTVFSGV
ncbi:MAG: SDR family oxidoreductase [Sediminibacterium sp.]|jgi:NAD(P)-dependent dehydrogenase (short-subunit alcohol dehydrogenase family)